MEITKDLIERLANPDITLREYHRIQSLISDRVNQTWHFICTEQNRNLEWWAFSNDRELGRGNGSDGGSFDYSKDRDYIMIQGEYGAGYYKNYPPGLYAAFEIGFPTELLWDQDWMATIRGIIAQEQHLLNCHQTQKKQSRKDRKQKRNAILRSLRQKLTPEELKVVASNLTQPEKAILLK